MRCKKPECNGVVMAYGYCDINTENHKVDKDSAYYENDAVGYCRDCKAEYDIEEE